MANSNRHNRLPEQAIRLLPLVLAVILWSILVFLESSYLKKAADQSMFLFDWDFIANAISVPGGILGRIGAFFTQMLYMPWLGALLWTAMLALAYVLTAGIIGKTGTWISSIAILPAAVMVAACMRLGYGIFITRSQDWFFAPIIGYLLCLIPSYAVKNAKSTAGIAVILCIWTIIAYPFIGAFALGGTIAGACIAITNQQIPGKERIYLGLTGVIMAAVVPLVMHPFYTTLRLADCWMAGLPDISDVMWKGRLNPFRIMPFMPGVCILLARALAQIKVDTAAKDYGARLAVYAASVLTVWSMWFSNSNFRTELAMSDSIDRLDWRQALRIYENATSNPDDEPTRSMVMYRDLALLKLDRALESGFSMKDGSRQQESLTQLPMALQAGRQLYLHYGITGLCYRWCLEDAVEHGWSFATARYMAMLGILTDQPNMAAKYLDILDKTLFYRKWSAEQRSILNASGIESVSPYKEILPLMCYQDNMNNDMGKCESLLIRHFTRNRPDSTTPDYDKTALFWAMRTQSIPLFWEAFYHYVLSSQSNSIPRNVQEAAILYNSLESHGIELPYSEELKKSYSAFTQFAKSHPVRSISESRQPYYQRFGNTFYYFYYFIRDMQTY